MHKNNKTKIEIIIGILVISIFVLETVGYAYYNQILNIGGNLVLKSDGKVEITNVVLNSQVGAVEKSAPTFNDNSVSANVEFNVTDINLSYEISYDVTITNDSSYDYVFSNTDFSTDISVNDGSQVNLLINGISLGDPIPKKSSKTFSVTIQLIPMSENTDYDIDVSGTTEVEDNTNATLLVAIPSTNRTGNFTGSTEINHFQISAINGFDYPKNFEIYINSSNFELCDQSGNPLSSYTIDTSEEKTFDFYLKKLPGAQFASSKETIPVMYSYDDYTGIAGSLELSVDITEINDTEAPVISNIHATKNSAANNVHVVWNSHDDIQVDHFVVVAYKSNGTKVGNNHLTNGSETFIDFNLYNNTNNNDGSYYFIVYGVDSVGNTATTAEINNATVSAGHASRSATTNLKWYANVTYSGDNSGSVSEVLIGSDLSTTITRSGYTGNISVNSITMNGVTLQANSGYTTRTSGNNLIITIQNVTGDININTSTSCLVEGTDILLANGKTKKIEDITYYDLLAVWNYETGKLTYEYPIWIEQTQSINTYQLNEFSDGTILKTVGYHGVFNYDLNRFVSVDNKEEFHVGSTIAKIENGKLTKVKVTKISKVNEPVNYYHVVSARYYNIIANNLLTTDGTVGLSNIYAFDNNISWVNPNYNNVYQYEAFKDIVPYYLFYGLRMEDAKKLTDAGLSLNDFKGYLKANQLNEKMYLPIKKDEQGIILKVSTSLGINKLLHYGDIFTIPGKNDTYINTIDGKKYHSKDKVKIYYSTHFIKEI